MNKGFSTLFVVIVLGSVALGLILYLSTSSLWSIRSSIGSATSNQTRALIDACAEVALETMRENTSYTGSDSVTLEGNMCSYTVISNGGDVRTITVMGTIGNITRKLRITSTAFNPILISSWQEVGDF